MKPSVLSPGAEGHWPTLETLLMIERTIKESEIPPRRTELWTSLPKKMMYQTFKRAIEYLDASGKIMIDKEDRVVWVAADSPKLQALFDRAVRVR
ncbi:MAG: hypothetical protein LYZ69_06090 [Nitrososphaerales archaeon]|nr:hypothetical protein [Nitrososphaerales archaeon]